MRQLFILLVFAVAPGCVCEKPIRYPVGAVVHHGAVGPCVVTENAAGALRVVPPERAYNTDGVDFEAVKPGEARIDCGGDTRDAKITVSEAVKLEFVGGGTHAAPVKVGGSVGRLCVDAFDAKGNELQLGDRGVQVKFAVPPELGPKPPRPSSGPADHGMGMAIFSLGGPRRCTDDLVGRAPGIVTVEAEWSGLKATRIVEVVP